MGLLISRKVGKDNWELDKPLKEFKAELEVREQCTLMRTSSSTSYKRDSGKKRGDLRITLSSLISGNKNVSVQVCSFCDQHHLSAKCNVVTDIAARRLALRKKGKCFGCLKSGHIASNCPTKSKCPKCGYRHHVTLCEESKRKMTKTQLAKVMKRISQSPQEMEHLQSCVSIPAFSVVTDSESNCWQTWRSLKESASMYLFRLMQPKILNFQTTPRRLETDSSYLRQSLGENICK